MPPRAPADPCGGDPDSRHFWERTALGWHVAFGVLLLIAAVLALIDDDTSTPAALAGCGVLVVWAAWYAARGRQLWGDSDESRGLIYVAGTVLLFLAAVCFAAPMGVLLFIAIPQIYATLERVVWSTAVVVALFGLFALLLFARGSGPEIFANLGLSAAVSAVFGSWISGIIRQSVQRAELIGELQETRDQLATVAGERGALAERERLSRDIHDTIAQGFTSIVMLLEAADAMVGTDDVAARRHLELARRTARENLAETRSLVSTLTPAGLADASLVDAVRRIVERCGEEARLATGLTVGGQPRRLSSAAEVVLLRAAQESLANVRKHAGARRVDLHLDYADDETVLRVSDDGCGFDPERAAGFGLNGMRARVEEAGGSLRVDSSASVGTTVEVRVR